MTPLEKARQLFESAGLGFPPIPDALAPRMRGFGNWCFATTEPPLSPYFFAQFLEAAQDRGTEDYVVLAHAGHGVSSYAISSYTVLGALRILLQMSWGGAYSDHDAETRRIHDAFATLRGRWSALEERFAHDGGLVLVAHSDFYGGLRVRDGREEHASASGFDLDKTLAALLR